MNTALHLPRRLIELLLVPFDALPPTVALCGISVVTGALALWIVGKTTRQRSLERARDRITAGIYEIRLYLDSPRRVFSAQGRLLLSCLRYTGYLMPALLAMTIPLGALFLHLEPRFGLAPLRTDEPLVVRIDLADGTSGDDVRPSAEQDGITVTAPPLFDEDAHRLYLRVALDPTRDGRLALDTPGGVVHKKLSVLPSSDGVFPERSSGWAALLSYGAEPPLPSDTGITAIAVRHPASDGSWLGLGVPWWLFWLLVASIAALFLRRPMGVVI